MSSNSGMMHKRLSSLLDVLAGEAYGLSLSEIARRTALPVTTAHRHLHWLADEQLVQMTSDGRWTLGLKLFELGMQVPARTMLRKVAMPEMRALLAVSSRRVLLAVPYGDSILFVEECSPMEAGSESRLGLSAPMHLSAAGKLFLADMNPTALRSYVQRTALAGGTEHSLKSMDGLLVRIGRIREFGWAIERGEWQEGVVCVAAPLVLRQRLVGALALEASMRSDIAHKDIEELIASARRISLALEG